MGTRSHSLHLDLERLATLEPTSWPVLSLYLDTRPDQHGRDHFEPFVRKALAAQARAYASRTPEQDGFEEVAERMKRYLRDEVKASANSVALFVRAGDDGFFQPMQFDAPIDDRYLVISSQVYLYPLARLEDQYRCHAALVADSHSARLYIFELSRRIEVAEIENPKVSRTQAGGWSQARYQRHVDNFHLHHGKDVVETLNRLVVERPIDWIVLAAERVIKPELLRHLPASLIDHVIEASGLDMHTPEHEVMRITAEMVREADSKGDQSEVLRLFDEHERGGLGVVGAQATLAALRHGQVDELLIVASLDELQDAHDDLGDESPFEIETMIAEKSKPSNPRQARRVWLANQLVIQALRTKARIRLVEDPNLLAQGGGVGALLRYRINFPQPATEQNKKKEEEKMSKKNNLNPDHYKVAGRGRQGEGIEQASHRQRFNEEEARRADEQDFGERAGERLDEQERVEGKHHGGEEQKVEAREAQPRKRAREVNKTQRAKRR